MELGCSACSKAQFPLKSIECMGRLEESRLTICLMMGVLDADVVDLTIVVSLKRVFSRVMFDYFEAISAKIRLDDSLISCLCGVVNWRVEGATHKKALSRSRVLSSWFQSFLVGSGLRLATVSFCCLSRWCRD